MKKILTLVLLFLAFNLFANTNQIENYQRTYIPVYTKEGNLLLAIRVFKMNQIPSFLVVHPDTLLTEVLPIASLTPRRIAPIKKPGYFTHWNIATTTYFQLLNRYTDAPYPLENKGLRHIDSMDGNVLTIDLCPSSKPFEADFFKALVERANKTQKPVPITIAISGMWIIGHPDEFQWLIAQKKANKLDITWANHSFSHIYYSDLPYSQNFLLTPETNISSEILLTEQYLLEAGELPSIFFRFPGLVSNKKLIKTLRIYGLIPLGTDAWIANLERNHQTINPGGIILVHGNSNEHKGIVRIMPLLPGLQLESLPNALRGS